MKRMVTSLWFVIMAVGATAQTNTQTIHYSYDAKGRLTSAYYTRASTNMAVLFTYDLNDNRNTRTDYGLAEANGDLDGDDLDDTAELGYFNDLNEDGSGDPDADGLANSNELAAAGNPLVKDTDNDGQDDRDEFVAGTGLDDGAEYFYVTNQVQAAGGLILIQCDTRAGRTYQLQSAAQAIESWADEGSPYAIGTDGPHAFESAQTNQRVYRIKVWVTP